MTNQCNLPLKKWKKKKKWKSRNLRVIIRDSFVMFKNWFEAIDALPEEFQLEAYKSLSKYGLTGVMPEDNLKTDRAHNTYIIFREQIINSIY